MSLKGDTKPLWVIPILYNLFFTKIKPRALSHWSKCQTAFAAAVVIVVDDDAAIVIVVSAVAVIVAVVVDQRFSSMITYTKLNKPRPAVACT